MQVNINAQVFLRFMMLHTPTVHKTAPSPVQSRLAVSVFFFLAGFTFASWASRIPHIQGRLGLSEAQLGTVLFALPVGLMISLLVAGGLITRVGSKAVLIVATLIYAGLLVLLGMASTVWQLAIGLFLFGIAGNLCNISMNTQAVSVQQQFGRSIMAGFHGIWSLAGFSGAAVGTAIISLGWQPEQHFLLVAVLAMLTAAIFAKNTVHNPGNKQQPAFALPNRRILQLGLIAFGCLVCEGTMFDWSGVYFKKAVQAPANLTTLGYAAFMGCMATGRFIADRVVTRIGARRLLQGSGLVIAAGLALAVIFPNLVVATMAFMLVGFGVSSVVPVVYSLAGNTTTMSASQALAAVSTVGFAGFLAGPPLIGFIAEAFNIRIAFALVALIGLSTSVLATRIKI